MTKERRLNLISILPNNREVKRRYRDSDGLTTGWGIGSAKEYEKNVVISVDGDLLAGTDKTLLTIVESALQSAQV